MRVVVGAAGAVATKDEFLRAQFREAGFKLGRMVATLWHRDQLARASHADPDSLPPLPAELEVAAVGSVWTALPLMREDFIRGCSSTCPGLMKGKEVAIQPLTRVAVKEPVVTSAIGAAWKAAHVSWVLW